MKRYAEPSEVDDGPYVQQPVSCQFCRSRKLKCDRARPACFNCRSRDKSCIYNINARRKAVGAAPPASLDGPSAHLSLTENLDLAHRVARLERVVFAHDASGGESGAAKQQAVERAAAQTAISPTSDIAGFYKGHRKISQRLEDLLVEGSPGTGALPASATPDLTTAMRFFPTFRDAKMLLDYFIETVDATYRILHIPSTRNMLEMLCDRLKASHTPSATELSLFLCIFGASAYVSKKDFHLESPALLGFSRPALSELWIRQAVELIIEPPVAPSVTALQTLVHLSHLCTQMEGLEGRYKILGMSAIQMARALKLHCLDTPSNLGDRLQHGADRVDIEVKRRIWWHMVASDWLLSFTGGSNDGTYFLHPQQMVIFHPSNVEDNDIPEGKTYLPEESYSLPLDEPTSLSYFLYRIKSATLVREVVDSLPVILSRSTTMENNRATYDKVMVLDQKYQLFIKSLPPFFQLTIRNQEAHSALLQVKPYLEWQRYLINFVLHSQLAQLHRPFFIRGLQQPEYEASHMQCIRSAEMMIAIQTHGISNHGIGSFTYLLQHFLAAIIILTMEVCSKPDSPEAPRQRQDIIGACQTLEIDLNAKLASPNDAPKEAASSAQLKVLSLKSTVNKLRGIVRRHVCGNDLNPAKSSSVKLTSNEGANWLSEQQSPVYANEQSTDETSASVLAGQFETVTGKEASDEFFMNELWDGSFTFGSMFNDTDWNTFSSNLWPNTS